MISRRAIVVATLAVASWIGAPIAQDRASGQAMTLETPGGTLNGTLYLSSGRTPVVFVIAEAGAAAIGATLAAEGVAAFGYDAGASASLDAEINGAVAWITKLRNDERFPTVTVMGFGAASTAGAIAARMARADAYVSVSPPIDESRLIVPVLHLDSNASISATDARAVAEFARKAPPLGRKGTYEPRPTSPRRSPRMTTVATIGGSRMAIEYGSPQKRGRTIWGVLVGWNGEWMPGADEATTVVTDVPMKFGTLMVPAGDHTFYTWPDRDRFQLIVSKDVGQFHTVYNSNQELGRTDMTVTRRTESVEGLTFAIEPQGDAGVLKLIWDDREYSVTLTIAPRGGVHD
jgi:Protein of unknown function (DUF2911)